MFIGTVRGKPKYFPEISDFPYAHTLAPEARAYLEASLNEKIDAYWRQKRYIAILMGKKDAIAKKVAARRAA